MQQGCEVTYVGAEASLCKAEESRLSARGT